MDRKKIGVTLKSKVPGTEKGQAAFNLARLEPVPFYYLKKQD
jgi:hypothetical protein